MQKLAEQILAIIEDYHCDRGFKMNTKNIIDWANQFDANDRTFILSEFLHILNQGIYISKEKAYDLLIEGIKKIAAVKRYKTVEEFLDETVFLNMQAIGKSQSILLNMLDELLTKFYNKGIKKCGLKARKNYIYIDDVLATGRTILGDFRDWLSTKENGVDNLSSILKGNKNLSAIIFCRHCWASSNIKISLKLHFGEDRLIDLIKIYSYYNIENHTKVYNPRLNFVYPDSNQPQLVQEFLDGLTIANKFENVAYRNPDSPSIENFYSSSENRKRFEDIFLSKGLEILDKAKVLSNNHRPLGSTNPYYKTLGTGTLFFTWSNISNTCPIVFWWNNHAHNWKGLFPLYNRGN